MCNLASIALPRFVKERTASAESQGRPKLIGSHNAANRCTASSDRLPCCCRHEFLGSFCLWVLLQCHW